MQARLDGRRQSLRFSLPHSLPQRCRRVSKSRLPPDAKKPAADRSSTWQAVCTEQNLSSRSAESRSAVKLVQVSDRVAVNVQRTVRPFGDGGRLYLPSILAGRYHDRTPILGRSLAAGSAGAEGDQQRPKDKLADHRFGPATKNAAAGHHATAGGIAKSWNVHRQAPNECGFSGSRASVQSFAAKF